MPSGTHSILTLRFYHIPQEISSIIWLGIYFPRSHRRSLPFPRLWTLWLCPAFLVGWNAPYKSKMIFDGKGNGIISQYAAFTKVYGRQMDFLPLPPVWHAAYYSIISLQTLPLYIAPFSGLHKLQPAIP